MPDSSLRQTTSSKKILLSAVVTVLIFVLVSYVWHQLYHHQLTVDPDYRRDIFRHALYDSWAPFYIWKMPWKAYNGWILLMALVTAALLIKFYSQLEQLTWVVLVPCALWLLFALVFASSDHPDRLSGAYAHYKTFADDIPFFTNAADVLRNYLVVQPDLHVHGQHYPPGYLVLLKLGGVSFFRILNFAAALGSLVFTWKFTQKTFGNQAGAAAAFLLALMPGFLIYPTLDPVAIPTFFTVCAFYLLYQLVNGKSYPYSVLLALVLFMFILCSFIAAVWLVFALGFLWFNRKSLPIAHLLKQFIVCAFTLGLLFTLLRIFTGLNIVDCLLGSVHRDQTMNTPHAFDSVPRFLFRVTANMLGICISCLPVFIFSGFTKTVYGKAFIFTALVYAGCGYFFGEAERIFVLMQPFIAIAAAAYLTANKFKTAWVIGFTLFFSSVFEVLFHHFA